jgi:hypothetical protein
MARQTAECPHDERGVGELLDANDPTRADAEDVDELRHEPPARRPGSTAVAAEPDDDGTLSTSRSHRSKSRIKAGNTRSKTAT